MKTRRPLVALLALLWGPAAPEARAAQDIRGWVRQADARLCADFNAANFAAANKDYRLLDELWNAKRRDHAAITTLYAKLGTFDKLRAYWGLAKPTQDLQAIRSSPRALAKLSNPDAFIRKGHDATVDAVQALHKLCPGSDGDRLLTQYLYRYDQGGRQLRQALASARSRRIMSSAPGLSRRAGGAAPPPSARRLQPRVVYSSHPDAIRSDDFKRRLAPSLRAYHLWDEDVSWEVRNARTVARLGRQNPGLYSPRLVVAANDYLELIAQGKKLTDAFARRDQADTPAARRRIQSIEARLSRAADSLSRNLGAGMAPSGKTLYAGFLASAANRASAEKEMLNEARGQIVGTLLARDRFIAAVPSAKGKHGGWAVGLSGLAAVEGLERESAAERYAEAILRKLGQSERRERLKPIAAALMDDFGLTQGVLVTPDGRISVVIRTPKGPRTMLASFEPATKMRGSPGGEALVVHGPDGRRLREYLSDGTRLRWWESNVKLSGGLLTPERRARTLLVTRERRDGFGLESESWFSLNGPESTVAVKRLRQDVPGSSGVDAAMKKYYEPLARKLGKTPVLGDAAQFLGWTGDSFYAWVVGAAQRGVGSATGTSYNRLEGIANGLKAYQSYRGADLMADFRNSMHVVRGGDGKLYAKVSGKPEILGIIATLQAKEPKVVAELKLRIYQLRAKQLGDAGLTPKTVGGKRFAALQFRPVTKEELAYGLLNLAGVGTYGARVSEQYGGAAGGVMSFLEDQARGLPTLLAFWGLSNLGRLAVVSKTVAPAADAAPAAEVVPIETASRAGTALVNGTRTLANAAHTPFSLYMTAVWGSGIPSNLTGLVSALNSGNSREFTQRLAQLSFDVGMTAHGIREAREARRRAIGDLTALRTALVDYLHDNPEEALHARALRQVNAALARLGRYEDVMPPSVAASHGATPPAAAGPAAPPIAGTPAAATAASGPSAPGVFAGASAPPAPAAAPTPIPSGAPHEAPPARAGHAAPEAPDSSLPAPEPAPASPASSRLSPTERGAISRRNIFLADMKRLTTHKAKILRFTRYLIELRAEHPDSFNDQDIRNTYWLAFNMPLSDGDLALLKAQMNYVMAEQRGSARRRAFLQKAAGATDYQAKIKLLARYVRDSRLLDDDAEIRSLYHALFGLALDPDSLATLRTQMRMLAPSVIEPPESLHAGGKSPASRTETRTTAAARPSPRTHFERGPNGRVIVVEPPLPDQGGTPTPDPQSPARQDGPGAAPPRETPRAGAPEGTPDLSGVDRVAEASPHRVAISWFMQQITREANLSMSEKRGRLGRFLRGHRIALDSPIAAEMRKALGVTEFNSEREQVSKRQSRQRPTNPLLEAPAAPGELEAARAWLRQRTAEREQSSRRSKGDFEQRFGSVDEMDPQDLLNLYRAHRMFESAEGKNGRQAGRGNFTPGQNAAKLKRLYRRFSPADAQWLMDEGYAGTEGKLAEPAPTQTSETRDAPTERTAPFQTAAKTKFANKPSEDIERKAPGIDWNVYEEPPTDFYDPAGKGDPLISDADLATVRDFFGRDISAAGLRWLFTEGYMGPDSKTPLKISKIAIKTADLEPAPARKLFVTVTYAADWGGETKVQPEVHRSFTKRSDGKTITVFMGGVVGSGGISATGMLPKGWGTEFYRRFIPGSIELGASKFSLDATNHRDGRQGARVWAKFGYSFSEGWQRDGYVNGYIAWLRKHFPGKLTEPEIQKIRQFQLPADIAHHNLEDSGNGSKQTTGARYLQSGERGWGGIIPNITDFDSPEMRQLTRYLGSRNKR